MNLKRLKTVGSFLIVAVGIAAVAYLIAVPPVERAFPAFSPETTPEVRAQMIRSIERLGPDRAYILLAASYKDTPSNFQHGAAHIFGEALYEAQGVSGVTTCDDGYNFGCFHGFFIEAVSHEGLDVLDELNGECTATSVSSACRHGIGHGILEYLGLHRLTDALEACTRIEDMETRVGGCTGGVFMEYNLPLEVLDGVYTIAPRELEDPANPYAPCDTVADRFAESCHHELPQWWGHVYGREDFMTIGRLCAGAAGEHNRYTCYMGAGTIAASAAKYDVERAIELCKDMPNQEAEGVCLIYTAGAFSGSVGDHDAGVRACEAAPEAYQDECRSFL